MSCLALKRMELQGVKKEAVKGRSFPGAVLLCWPPPDRVAAGIIQNSSFIRH